MLGLASCITIAALIESLATPTGIQTHPQRDWYVRSGSGREIPNTQLLN
jgi:hypothetical protein